MYFLRSTYASVMLEWLTESFFFDPKMTRQRLNAHEYYQSADVRQLRSIDNLLFLEFKELKLKSMLGFEDCHLMDANLRLLYLTLNRPGGGGAEAGSSLCCAETVNSRKLKLCDFYYILISFNSEYKPVPWDIHCCHGNAIVKECFL